MGTINLTPLFRNSVLNQRVDAQDVGKNQTGLSLIETLIAMSILVTLSLGLAELSQRSTNVQNNLRITGDFNNLTTFVALTLQNNAACKNSFTLPIPVSFENTALNTPIDIPRIQDAGNNTVLTLNEIPSPGLKITGLRFSRFQDNSGGGGTSYLGMVHIEGTKLGSFLGAPVISTKMDIPVSLITATVGSTVTVTDCGMNWGLPVEEGNSGFGNSVRNLGVYKSCFLKMTGTDGCGRCIITRNADSTWTLDRAACNGISFGWCNAYCYN